MSICKRINILWNSCAMEHNIAIFKKNKVDLFKCWQGNRSLIKLLRKKVKHECYDNVLEKNANLQISMLYILIYA